MRHLGAAGVVAFTLLARAGSAHADHHVYSPIVEQGVLEFEARVHRTVDNAPEKDNGQVHKYEIGYGVNQWWHTALFGELEKEPGASLKYNATAWENIFQLTPQGKYWLDAGLYFEYARGASNGTPDEIETKVLLEKEVRPLVLTANLIFTKEIGRNAETGLGFEYALRANYPWTRSLQFGIEAYGEPGRIGRFDALSEQNHVVGPVLSGRFNIAGIKGAFGYEVGYLFGVTPGSPSGTVKGLLEYEVPF